MKKQKFIASYEEACAKLGVSTDLPDVSTFDEDMHKHLIALHKLRRITKVNGGSYVPDLGNTGQRKYHPYFWIEKKEGSSGFGLTFDDFGYDISSAFLGVRLACATPEQAKFQGENCTDLYLDLLS